MITTKKNPTTTSDDLPDLRILPSLNKSRSLGSTSSTSASTSTSKVSYASLDKRDVLVGQSEVGENVYLFFYARRSSLS